MSRWAQGGAKTDPGTIKVELGWIAEKPAYQFFNWLLGRSDDMLAHYEEQGVADWLVTTPYLVGGLAMGSDRAVYKAVQANTGLDPTLDGTGTNWIEYVPMGDVSTKGLLRLSSIPEAVAIDASTALSPFALDFINAQESKNGVIKLATSGEAQALSEAFKAITSGTLGTVVATLGSKGLVKLADAQAVLDGTDATIAVTPASLGALANLLATNGYQQFPGGLIIQWGIGINVSGVAHDVVLPLAFPNGFFAATCTASESITDSLDPVHDPGAKPQLLTHIRLSCVTIVPLVFWIAIGN